MVARRSTIAWRVASSSQRHGPLLLSAAFHQTREIYLQMEGLLDRLGEEGQSTEMVASDVKSKLLGWSKEHTEFKIAEHIPLEHVRDLGQGSQGSVDEVRCCGELVARKRIPYKKEQFQTIRKELKILQKLDDKHKHIIKFVGSYSQITPGGRLLGLLLWPVAVCDLAVFLEELSEFQGQVSSTYLASLGLHTTSQVSLAFLKRTYGCLANAISYLHENKIRHKDLKPQNILLSKEGLYVADFGISLDFGDLSQSVTNGLERGTPKYFAPELEDYGERGRSADIYSLGCIYLEITTVLCGETLKAFWGDKPFLYRKEQERIQQWIKVLREKATRKQIKIQTILPLIKGMLHVQPNARPRAGEVVRELYERGGSGGTLSVLHGPCCNGLSLVEELFDSVAVAKSEERKSKNQIQNLNVVIDQLEQENEALRESFEKSIKEREAAVEALEEARVREINDAHREGVMQNKLKELEKENERLRKDLETRRAGETKDSESQAEYLANAFASWEPGTESSEHGESDYFTYPSNASSVSGVRDLNVDEPSTSGHDIVPGSEDYGGQGGEIYDTPREVENSTQVRIPKCGELELRPREHSNSRTQHSKQNTL